MPVLRGGPFRDREASVETEVFTYNRSGHSHQPLAPPLSPDMLGKIISGARQTGRSVNTDSGRFRHLLVALPREKGPCVLALAVAPELRLTKPPRPFYLISVVYN